MQEVAVFEAKTRFSELLVAVENGEQFVITRRGVPVARLVAASPTRPPKASSRRAGIEQAIAALQQLRAGVTLGIDSRAAIDQGRD